ncbi:hypothetical protein N8J89_16185 [Crossiella sp. CA-258035]|uniref:hypothetical protein n=1 Tax=Crossiella sp. CA-258035 TaxID=2981138 RepID=UPI0024BD1D74|nr:hypothetical protein [Crossiella sp. CA-258035]WHT22539.1 hypothetical protein N8J89_16185 [Crossiella sp. CA-258035]
MPGEPRAWWEGAPLDAAGRRRLSGLAPHVVAGLVEEGKALAWHAVRPQRRALQDLLGEPEDLDQQVVVWILEAAASYDPARGPWTAHLAQRVRQLAGDRWRTEIGQSALRRLKHLREKGYAALEPGERLFVNRISSLLPGGRCSLDRYAEMVPCTDELIEGLELRCVRSQVTRAVLRAGLAEDGEQPRMQRALVSYLLRQVHGHSIRRLVSWGIHHRTIAALEQALHHRVREQLERPA